MEEVIGRTDVPVEPPMEPITGTFGAAIKGCSVAALGACDAKWLEEALRKYKVLVFRDQQHVTPQELAKFGSLLGEVDREPHHIHKTPEGAPAVKILVMDMETASSGLGNPWHTDGCNGGSSLRYSILQAIDVPSYGRDTAFADMEAAYDNLSPPMQEMLSKLTAHYNWDSKPGWPGAEHPVIWTDPINGRKTLYVNVAYTKRILELHKRESDYVLRCLFEMSQHPILQLRISWRVGDIVVWDNRKTQHAIIFDRRYRRVMHRVMVS